MDRQATFLLALGLLIAAAAMVSVSGWVLLARDRRTHRAAGTATSATAATPFHPEVHEER